MKRIKGLEALIGTASDLPETGWIFVGSRAVPDDVAALVAAEFLVADDEDEEIDMEDEYATFLEAPTFRDVLILKQRSGSGDVASVAEGCIHYLRYDAFQD